MVDEASIEQVSQALDAATTAFASWKKTYRLRSGRTVLFRAAARIRETKDDWNAVLVLEVGKPWIEADADTAEAIDFLEFYAREALRYANPPPLTPIAGEKNWLTYLPLGVGVVIPPVEFRFCHHGGDDVGGDRDRQYRGAEAFVGCGGDRGAVRGSAARARAAGRAC